MVEDNGFQIDGELQRRIEAFAQRAGTTPTDVVRLAFDQYVCLRNPVADTDVPDTKGESVLDRWRRAGLVGCIDDPSLPDDLTSNPIHMDGFGRD